MKKNTTLSTSRNQSITLTLSKKVSQSKIDNFSSLIIKKFILEKRNMNGAPYFDISMSSSDENEVFLAANAYDAS